MSSAFSILKIFLGKLHFIATLAMFFFIGLMVVEDNMSGRALLLLPVVLCFAASKVLFAMDQANMVQDILEHNKRK